MTILREQAALEAASRVVAIAREKGVNAFEVAYGEGVGATMFDDLVQVYLSKQTRAGYTTEQT